MNVPGRDGLQQLTELNAQEYSPRAAAHLAWLCLQSYEHPEDTRLAVAVAGGKWIPVPQIAGLEAGLVLIGAHDAVLTVRGTDDVHRGWSNSAADWWSNLRATWCPGPLGIGDRVHCGYAATVWAALPAVLEVIESWAPGRRLWITGHSKGGAEAQLMAAHLAVDGRPPQAVYTFGAPRVGCQKFSRLLASVVGCLVRHQGGADPVPLFPHVGLPGWGWPGIYRHGGDLVYYPPGDSAPVWNPSWLQLFWLRWQGFRGGLLQLLGDRVRDHAAKSYQARAACFAELNTINNNSKGTP